MIGPKLDKVILDSVVESHRLIEIGFFSIESMVFWVAGCILFALGFWFKKKLVRISIVFIGFLLVTAGLFVSTMPTEESEISYKEGYKEWQQKSISYINQLETEELHKIKDIKKLRSLDKPQQKSGMTAIEYLATNEELVKEWVEIKVDRNLKKPYLTYQELGEDIEYDKNITRLQKGHMMFYPKTYPKGKYNVILHTNKKP